MQLMASVNPDLFSNNGDDDYGWRSFMLGVMYIGSGGAVDGHLPFSEEYYMEKYYKMYSQKLRPLVRNASPYHILPYDATTANAIKGAVFLFKHTNTDGSVKRVVFKGLNPTTNYNA